MCDMSDIYRIVFTKDDYFAESVTQKHPVDKVEDKERTHNRKSDKEGIADVATKEPKGSDSDHPDDAKGDLVDQLPTAECSDPPEEPNANVVKPE